MSLSIKPDSWHVKDGNGQYRGTAIFSSTLPSEAQQIVTESIAEINAVKATIPADYTELSNKVDGLDDDLTDLSDDVSDVKNAINELNHHLNEIASFPTIDVDETVEYNCPVSAITDRLIPTWELDDIRPGDRLYWNVDTVSASVHSSDFTNLNIRAVQYDANETVLSRTSYPSTLTINANAARVSFGILYSKTATTGESGSTFAETFAVKFQASYDGNFDVTIKALDSVLTEQGDTWEV